jgi:hypothetical protein
VTVEALPAVIRDARRRQRQRRTGVAALLVAVALGVGTYTLFWRGSEPPRGGAAANSSRPARNALPVIPKPVPGSTTITLWMVSAGPDPKTKTTPFGNSLALFRQPRRRSDVIPASVQAPPFRGASSFAETVAHMKTHPGKLLLRQSRLIESSDQSVYFVPTTTGWVCFVASADTGCLSGYEPQGINWRLMSDSDDSGALVIGLASPRVTGVDVRSGRTARRATLSHGSFIIGLPLSLPPPTSFGDLVVHYRDLHTATITLR